MKRRNPELRHYGVHWQPSRLPVLQVFFKKGGFPDVTAGISYEKPFPGVTRRAMAGVRYGGAVAGVLAALCCAVVSLMLTGGGGAQSVLILLSGGRLDTESPLEARTYTTVQPHQATGSKQLSVMRLLSGEAVEPLLRSRKSREGNAAAARQMEPAGWRHAKVRWGELGEEAEWARRYDKASRRHTQERRAAVQGDEAEEKMYRAHQTSHAPSFASIAAYMAPEGEP